MKTRIESAVAVLGVFLAAGSLWAHHSVSAFFDISKPLTITGTMAKVDWRNPHIEFSVDVKGDRGQVETWAIIGWAPSVYGSRNSGKADFVNAIGQTVTVEVSLARDGSRSGHFEKITFPGGKSVGAGLAAAKQGANQ